MTTLMLACGMLRPELEMLCARMAAPPAISYLEVGLHDVPDRLRAALQNAVDTVERENKGELTILYGYTLCGRGLCGVHAGRATLVIPRLHDCVPLFLGITPREALARVPGPRLWISAGMQDRLTRSLLNIDERRAEYETKFGPLKAARLLQAERRLFENYTELCYIRWTDLLPSRAADAKKIADYLALHYSETEGATGYLAELLAGGKDPEKFLHLAPGQTLAMDADGVIQAASCTPDGMPLDKAGHRGGQRQGPNRED